MKEYETLYISHPEKSEGEIATFNDRVKQLVEKHGGRLFLAKNLGKKNLSYPIQKQSKGTYTCLDYASAGGAVSEIERLMRLDESVMRFLTTIKNDNVDVETRAAEIIARGEDETTAPPAGEEKREEKKEEKEVSHGNENE